MTRTYTTVRRSFFASLAILGLAFASNVSAGTILGSQHDFSAGGADGWTGGEICVACHTPHNSQVITDAPLWNHTLTTATFTTYTSPSFDGADIGQPAGSSVLCLSCHDGTVAVDSFGGGAAGSYFMPGNANFGTDLTNDHPISFTYDAALATADPGLFDPTATTITIGSGDKTKTGTIDEVMLLNGQLQCASCHDVHNGFTSGVASDPLLRITKQASTLCLTCHNK